MYLYIPKSVHAASKRQCSGAGREVQVTWGWYSSLSEDGTRRLIQGFGKGNAVLREFYRSLVTKRGLTSVEMLSVFKFCDEFTA